LREPLRLLSGLSCGDGYSAALGRLHPAEVVTGDPEIKKLEGEITITWQTG
jgi:hypothetical protein